MIGNITTVIGRGALLEGGASLNRSRINMRGRILIEIDIPTGVKEKKTTPDGVYEAVNERER